MLRHLVGTAGWIAAFTLLLIAMPTGNAHAYLDPGSGSLIIQIIIGGILALLVAVRIYWTRIVAFVTGKKPVEDPDAVQPQESDKFPGDDRQ